MQWLRLLSLAGSTECVALTLMLDPHSALLVSPKPPPQGGIATWTELILKEAIRHPDVTLLHYDIAPRWRAIHETGRVRRVIGGGMQFLRDYRHIRRMCLAMRPEALHMTTSASLASFRDVLVTGMTRRLGIRTLLHMRIGRLPRIAEDGGWEWKLVQRAALQASELLVLDHSSENVVHARLPSVPVRVIPNCIDVDSLTRLSGEVGKSNSPAQVLYVGWMLPAKGVVELVDAWAGIRDGAPRLCLIGPGDPNFTHSLRQKCVATGCADRLDIMGELPHAATLQRMATCDVFVLPSHTEGFPNVILEAMALGRCILATRVGAVSDMLCAGGPEPCGVVIQAGRVDDLRSNLSKLLSHTGLRRDLGRKAAARVESEYSVQRVFEEYVRAWRGPTTLAHRHESR